MSSIINPPNSGGGITQAQLDAAIQAHFQMKPHLSQANVQALINATVMSEIANLMLPTYGNNYQGTRNDNSQNFTGTTFQDVNSHTVLGVNNGEVHDIMVSYNWSKSVKDQRVQFQVTKNGAPLTGEVVSVEIPNEELGNISLPRMLHFNEPLQNGDVIALQCAEQGSGTATVQTSKIVLFETLPLQEAAGPAPLSISTPSTRFVTTFWNQMAGDPNGSASTTIAPSVSGGVGPFTFAWTLSNFTGVGSPNPNLVSATAQNGTAQVSTLAITYIKTFDMTVTVTDTSTGLTDSSTTQVNFNISETSN